MKAEHWRTDAFELWCWRRLLRVPWTARRSNQSTLKEISPEYSLKGLMLKLKLQYFDHLMWRTNSFEKALMLGKIEGRRRRGRQRMRWLDAIINSMDTSLSKLRSWWWTGRPGVLQSVGSQRVRHHWGTELSWTELYRKEPHLLEETWFQVKYKMSLKVQNAPETSSCPESKEVLKYGVKGTEKRLEKAPIANETFWG